MKNTKEFVIDFLIENKDKYVSGEAISNKLGLSRASVWKHINSLKKEGFDIESKNGSGYRYLGKSGEKISTYEIKHGLNTSIIGQNLYYFQEIDSTNTYAKKIADKSEEGTVVISSFQSQGRGRTGKKWVSNKDEGIYFSIILKPSIPIIQSSFLTQVAGASLLETLRDFKVKSEIKWPNDIVINGKKVAGILTELTAEMDEISNIIIGIGINLFNDKFEDNIENIATSLKIQGFNVDTIDFLKKFFEVFEKNYVAFINGDIKNILNCLRENSAVIGKKVFLITKENKKEVYIKDIDDLGNLIIENSKGEEESIFSGEISIRGLDSYI